MGSDCEGLMASAPPEARTKSNTGTVTALCILEDEIPINMLLFRIIKTVLDEFDIPYSVVQSDFEDQRPISSDVSREMHNCDAAILVIQNQQASVSLLQRKFRIGYSRAGRLIDELESLGIITGYSGSKAREVLVDESYLSNIFND